MDGSMLAIAREGGVAAVYEVEYDANNVPTLSDEEKYLVTWGGDADIALAMDFDPAGNLYIVSDTKKGLMVYSLPKVDNSYTTRVSYYQKGEGLNNVGSDNDVRKVLRNGQVMIIKNGRTYNTLGVEMK